MMRLAACSVTAGKGFESGIHRMFLALHEVKDLGRSDRRNRGIKARPKLIAGPIWDIFRVNVDIALVRFLVLYIIDTGLLCTDCRLDVLKYKKEQVPIIFLLIHRDALT